MYWASGTPPYSPTSFGNTAILIISQALLQLQSFSEPHFPWLSRERNGLSAFQPAKPPKKTPYSCPAHAHLHYLPGLHAQGGEVAAPVNGNRLAQEGVQSLQLRPAQPTQVPSGGGRWGLRVGVAACRDARGHCRDRNRSHLRNCSVRALSSALRRHSQPGPGAPTAETEGWLRGRGQGEQLGWGQSWGRSCSDGAAVVARQSQRTPPKATTDRPWNLSPGAQLALIDRGRHAHWSRLLSCRESRPSS